MPHRELLTESQRLSFQAPASDEREMVRYYTLSPDDLALINRHRGDPNRLGFAVMLCYLRFPGRIMLGDRRLPFAVEFDQVWVNPQLCRAEANQFLKELEGLLLPEAIEVPERKRPDRQSRVGYEGADTCRSCTKSSSVRLAARLSRSRENITAVIPRTPRHGKRVP